MSDQGKGLILSHSFNLPGKLHRSGQSRSGDTAPYFTITCTRPEYWPDETGLDSFFFLHIEAVNA